MPGRLTGVSICDMIMSPYNWRQVVEGSFQKQYFLYEKSTPDLNRVYFLFVVRLLLVG